MNRRGFLGSILALGAAPAIVRVDSLMRVIPRELVLLQAEPVVLTGNRMLTMVEITREALRIAHDQAAFIRTVNRQFDANYKAATVKIRRPH